MQSEAPTRPLVLVHGLLDTPRLFSRLERRLEGQHRPVFSPHLPHRFGAIPLRKLAQQLDGLIQERWGAETTIDLLGFSMGGVIGRTWLQEFGGAKRTHRFISVGSPQQGTLTAQCIPAWLFAGLADMKRGSPLLRSLEWRLRRVAVCGVPELLLPLGFDGVPWVASRASNREEHGCARLDASAIDVPSQVA